MQKSGQTPQGGQLSFEARKKEVVSTLAWMNGSRFDSIMKDTARLNEFLTSMVGGKSADEIIRAFWNPDKSAKRNISYTVAASILGERDAFAAMANVVGVIETTSAAYDYKTRMNVGSIHANHPVREILEVAAEIAGMGTGPETGREVAFASMLASRNIKTNALGNGNYDLIERAGSILHAAQQAWGTDKARHTATNVLGQTRVNIVIARMEQYCSTP